MNDDPQDTPNAQDQAAQDAAHEAQDQARAQGELRSRIVAFESTVLAGVAEVDKARAILAKRPPKPSAPPSAADESAPPAAERRAARAARAGKTVLVVEDEESVREIVRVVLEDAGYRVIEAANGQEALDLLCAPPTTRSARRVRPACIVLDLMLPVLSGAEMLELYRLLPSVPPAAERAPVMVLTAAVNAERRAQELGAEGHCGKPFRIDALLAEVDRLALSLPADAEPEQAVEAAEGHGAGL